ncbi:glycoside hydrolase family 15 protein [Rhodococcus antarcticus]|uniref:Glycoside hydrolase family 15 protein n=1 Tax=Rhodococcus antarcticus TaxID=2987751 RepID=A0ABY6NZP7_9NOCA|nr:glycoside hydrolase family 15 protein [Rhodococcus antarcticus]UZJ24576.1 glycoside hydrolase family 15 protein [Rhodococcus antarcticus]
MTVREQQEQSLIEDYALVGDLHTVALVSRRGSVDWLCLPRFDSGACFAALLGGEQHGHWQIAPTAEVLSCTRSYRGETLVLDTEMTTSTGTVRLTDAMPPRDVCVDLVRMVEVLDGEVELELRWTVRYDYGSVVPWVRHLGLHGPGDDGDERIEAIAGPDAVVLRGSVLPAPVDSEQVHAVTFTLRAGERMSWSMQWFSSVDERPPAVDVAARIRDTLDFWEGWSAHGSYSGPYRDAVHRSLLTLKALTYAPSGGIVAAPTTSLPEVLGGERNWDYRYCWLRDATLTLTALAGDGYLEEAAAWREWLLRAIAGSPTNLQILYGVMGERQHPEWEATWLPGYGASSPVRIGNAAAGQLQLDVYGEVMEALYLARVKGLDDSELAWSLQRALIEHLAGIWQSEDQGIWEVRGPARHFTHSRVMVWVAFDRAVRTVEEFGVEGPVDRWREIRDAVHAEVCDQGWNSEVGAFTQYYGGTELDAAVLLIPSVGFLSGDDERVVSTVDAIGRSLRHGDVVDRYTTGETQGGDGLSGKEGAFLACSFWFVDALVLTGRADEGRAMFENLLLLANDVGLLAEEYDPVARRLLGNFPQAFSHLALVNSALLLDGPGPRARVSAAGA